jgi:hypothetical protein
MCQQPLTSQFHNVIMLIENFFHYDITLVPGIGFHSFVDGILYAVTFSVSVFTGVLAATALVDHQRGWRA